MDPEHKATLRAQYQTQGQDLKQRFRANEAEYATLEKTVQQHDAQLHELAARLAGREAAQRRLAEVESALVQAKAAEEQLGTGTSRHPREGWEGAGGPGLRRRRPPGGAEAPR